MTRIKIAYIMLGLTTLILLFVFKIIDFPKSDMNCIFIEYNERGVGCKREVILPDNAKRESEYHFELVELKHFKNSKEQIENYIDKITYEKNNTNALKISLKDGTYKSFISTLDLFMHRGVHTLCYKNDTIVFFKDTIALEYYGHYISFNDKRKIKQEQDFYEAFKKRGINGIYDLPPPIYYSHYPLLEPDTNRIND